MDTYEDDRRSLLLCEGKGIAHKLCPIANKHLYKLRACQLEEGGIRLCCAGSGEERLACAGRSVEKDALQ